MARVIVFDVNETLLDLGALDLHFRRVFGAGGVRAEWFTQVIELAIVATATNVYFDFAVVGDAALTIDRKSTRLNSSHSQISYAVFCLKKKTGSRRAADRTGRLL